MPKSASPSPSLKGSVALLTLSGLVVKAAGLLFKIPLTSLVGEEGMGYFNSAYTLFTWVYMLSTAGLPAAASMMIARAGNHAAVYGRRILRLSLAMFTLIGLGGTAALVFGATDFARLMKAEKAAPAILAIAPTLALIGQSAALRGYFQGIGDLRPHALSQIAEALGKAILGTALASIALKNGRPIHEAAAYAALGLSIGIGMGLALLWIFYAITRREKNKEPDFSEREPWQRLAGRLWKLALPITLSSSVMSLTSLIDSLIMTRQLHAQGMNQAEVMAVYGNYTSLALPMFNLPPILVYPIAYALLPRLGSLLSQGQTVRAREVCLGSVRACAALAFPCAIGLALMAEPILSLFFDPALASRGAPMLTILAPASAAVCFLALTNTVLQASGREKLPLYAMLIGAGIKLALSPALIAHFGKYGTPAATLIGYLVILLISVTAIGAATPFGPCFRPGVLLRPLIGGGLTGLAALGMSRILPAGRIGTMASILLGGGVWLFLTLCGPDRAQMLEFLPKSKKRKHNDERNHRGHEGQKFVYRRGSPHDYGDSAE